MNCLLWRKILSFVKQRRRKIEKEREENIWIRSIFFVEKVAERQKQENIWRNIVEKTRKGE